MTNDKMLAKIRGRQDNYEADVYVRQAAVANA